MDEWSGSFVRHRPTPRILRQTAGRGVWSYVRASLRRLHRWACAPAVSLMTAIGFEPANIDALLDAFGPSDGDRTTVSTRAAGIAEFYASAKADVPGGHPVGTTSA
jgi:hypothetical protein